MQEPTSRILDDGSQLEGTLRRSDKILHGPATLTFPDGSVHHAIFVNGILDGAASTSKDGVVEKYTYVKGKKEGPARWTYPDGTFKDGEYWKGKLQGTVRVTSPSRGCMPMANLAAYRASPKNKEFRYVRTRSILI